MRLAFPTKSRQGGGVITPARKILIGPAAFLAILTDPDEDLSCRGNNRGEDQNSCSRSGVIRFHCTTFGGMKMHTLLPLMGRMITQKLVLSSLIVCLGALGISVGCEKGGFKQGAQPSDAPNARTDLLTLLKAARDKDDRARIAAVSALCELSPPSPEVVNALVDSLHDKNVVIVNSAVWYLGRYQLSSEKVVPILAKLLVDERRGIPELAASGLRLYGKKAKASVPALLTACASSAPSIRRTAVQALGDIDPELPEVRDALERSLKDPTFRVKVEAARLLWHANYKRERAISILRSAIEEPTSDARRLAVKYVGKIGPAAKDSIPSLILAAKDSSSDVRYEVANALGNIQSEPQLTIPALLKLMKDADQFVRIESTRALARFHPYPASAVSALKTALLDEDHFIRVEAALAIRKLDQEAKNATKVISAALQHADSSVRSYAVERLGQLGAEATEFLPSLRKLMSDLSADVRSAAREAIRRIRPEE